MKKGRNFKGKKTNEVFKREEFSKAKDENKGKKVVCYECKKPGHIKPQCPVLKKLKVKARKKKHALKAETWSDTE